MKVIENTKGLVYFHAPKSKEKHITKTLTEDLFSDIGNDMYENRLTDWDGFSWSGEETDAFFDECMPIVRKNITLEVFPRSRYGYDCTMFRFHLDFAGMERDLARKIRTLKLKGKRSSRDRVEGWSITVPSLAFNHVSSALKSIGIKWESSKTSSYNGELNMRRSASEIINDLESRIARLESGSFNVGDQVECVVLGKQVKGAIKADHFGKYVFVDFGSQTLAVPYEDCELVNQTTAPWNPKDMFRDLARSFPSLPRGQAYSKNGSTQIIVSDIGKHSARINIAGPTYGVAKKIMAKISKLLAKKYGFEMVRYDTLALNDGSGYKYTIEMSSMGSISFGSSVETIRLY